MAVPRPDNEFHRLICSLNDEYGLGILQPSKIAVRSSKTRHNEESCDIYLRLKLVYERGHIPELLGRFRQEAQQVSRAWISNPRADPDLLPELSAPHGARSEMDRAALRRCLDDLLNGHLSRPAKRLPYESIDQPSPRPTSRPKVTGHDRDYVDSVPARPQVQARGHSDPCRASSGDFPPRLNANSFAEISANTSRTSLITSVFSSQEHGHTPQTSQETADAKSFSGRPAASPSQYQGDGNASSEVIISATDQHMSDDNRSIRDASSDHSVTTAIPEIRTIRRRWSGSTSAYSEGLTSEDFNSLLAKMPQMPPMPQTGAESVCTLWREFTWIFHSATTNLSQRISLRQT